jgi:hypothetical protein
VVTRSPGGRQPAAGVEYAPWPADPEGVDGVVHLAGEPILGKRWNAERKALLRSSRVDSTRELVEAIEGLERRPRVLVCASAVGIYGDRGDELLPESARLAPVGSDFLAEICQAWEREAGRAEDLGLRRVSVRIGLTLGAESGPLALMRRIFKLGLGGRIGSGEQWMSWIHADDLVRLFLHALDRDGARGALNGVAPNPVKNGEFTRALARALRRPALVPAPPLGMRVALGEVARVLTGSLRCVPERTLESGFEFRFPELEPALRDLLA